MWFIDWSDNLILFIIDVNVGLPCRILQHFLFYGRCEFSELTNVLHTQDSQVPFFYSFLYGERYGSSSTNFICEIAIADSRLEVEDVICNNKVKPKMSLL